MQWEWLNSILFPQSIYGNLFWLNLITVTPVSDHLKSEQWDHFVISFLICNFLPETDLLKFVLIYLLLLWVLKVTVRLQCYFNNLLSSYFIVVKLLRLKLFLKASQFNPSCIKF